MALSLFARVAEAQQTEGIGLGLVLLDTSPPTDSVRVFNFVESVAPGDTTLGAFGVPSARTVLLYGVPGFRFVSDGIDRRPAVGLPFDNSLVTTFADSAWFEPLVTTPHYGTTGLRWTAEEGDWLQVVVNESTGERLWLRRGRHAAQLTWDHLFRASDCAERHLDPATNGDSYVQPLRTSPSDDAPSVEPAWGGDCLAVIAVDGEWLNVRDGHEREAGAWWIRWRSGDRLLAWPGKASGLWSFIRASD